EMLDLLHPDAGQILAPGDARIIREGGIDRNGDQFLVAAVLVLKEQYADRPDPNNAARNERRPRDNQRVDRIAIGRARVRNEAVIGRVAHWRVQDPVDEQGARDLVELILHRLAADRYLDYDVDIVGWIVPGRDE